VVTGYRVVGRVLHVSTTDCSHTEMKPVNIAMLIPNTSLSCELYSISTCSLYVVTVNARTTVGFNESLKLNEIVIPSAIKGIGLTEFIDYYYHYMKNTYIHLI